MDMATALGMMGLGLGVLSMALGFLGANQGRRTDQVLASEGGKTRVLVRELHESTNTFVVTLSAEHAEIFTRLPSK